MCRSEYDTLGTSIKAALVYLGTALVKVCQHPLVLLSLSCILAYSLFVFFFLRLFYFLFPLSPREQCLVLML